MHGSHNIHFSLSALHGSQWEQGAIILCLKYNTATFYVCSFGKFHSRLASALFLGVEDGGNVCSLGWLLTGFETREGLGKVYAPRCKH